MSVKNDLSDTEAQRDRERKASKTTPSFLCASASLCRTLLIPGIAVALILLAASRYSTGQQSRPAARQAATKPVDTSAASDMALVKEFREKAAAFAATPQGRMLDAGAPEFEAAIRRLTRKTPATPAQLQRYRDTVGNLDSIIDKLKTWPLPPTIDVQRAKQPVTIDGKLDDKAWAAAKVIDTWFGENCGPGDAPPPQKTSVKMLWDDKYLYFGFTCQDNDIQAPRLKRDDNVWQTDCVEVFLMPQRRWGMYWEINVSASESLFDSLECTDCMHRDYFTHREESIHGLQYKAVLTGEPGKPTGYVVEIAVPFDQLMGWDSPPAVGKKLQVLATRIDLQGQPGHTTTAGYAYTPIQGWFHNLGCYPTVRLTD